MSKFWLALAFIIVIAVLAAGVFYFINSDNQSGTVLPTDSASSTGVPTLVLTAPTGTPAGAGQTVSDGTIAFPIPTDFGLAVTQQQIPVNSYIPPCDQDFNYCLYYIGSAYTGTNFESAGIRIEKRTDLTTTATCLNTAPTGYSNFTPTTTTETDYSVSEFTPLGDAAAGHFSTGTLYRLEFNGACYEFETRVGQSDFGNYPSGTIQQFTSADETSLQTEIHNLLDSFTLPSGETIAFPA
jgi:hypothetical protein